MISSDNAPAKFVRISGKRYRIKRDESAYSTGPRVAVWVGDDMGQWKPVRNELEKEKVMREAEGGC